jgi:hypothetical protein
MPFHAYFNSISVGADHAGEGIVNPAQMLFQLKLSQL